MKHKDTKARRHKERPLSKLIYAAFLCVFVPLCLCVSERQFQPQLHLAGRAGIRYPPKIGSERNPPGRTNKIEKVENVKNLDAEFQAHAFVKTRMPDRGKVD